MLSTDFTDQTADQKLIDRVCAARDDVAHARQWAQAAADVDWDSREQVGEFAVAITTESPREHDAAAPDGLQRART